MSLKRKAGRPLKTRSPVARAAYERQAGTFGDSRTKRLRTRSAQLQAALDDQLNPEHTQPEETETE